MVSITVSKMVMTQLIFVVPGMKVNGQYYHDVLLSQQMLPAIKHVVSDTFVFQQDNAVSYPTRTPLNSYSKKQQETPDLVGHDLWTPNSPYLNLVDYEVWDVMQQRVYECRMSIVSMS